MKTKVGFSSLVFFGDSLTDNGNLFALTGQPAPPYVNGRFSNGPTYAEIVPGLLGVTAQNFAFGGAEAANNGSPGENPIINLNAQVSTFLASLPPTGAPDGTAAVLNIGNNDYLRFAPASPAEVPAYIGQVVGSIGAEAQRLLAAGVNEIILFTLPGVAVTPLGATLAPAQLAGAQAIVEGHNAGIVQLATSLGQLGVQVEVVDIFRLAQELGADRETFGFKTTTTPVVAPGPDGTPVATGIDQVLDADEIAFFDAIHPTGAAHGVQAAFVAASLTADRVIFTDAGNDRITGSNGVDFVFSGIGNDTIQTGRGNDIVFAGTGNDVVDGGSGHDLIAGGSGNDILRGGDGDDLLAGNTGNDIVSGGNGNDVIIGGQGFDCLSGNGGNDLFILDVEQLLQGQAGPGAGTTFVYGDSGQDTLRFAVESDDLQDIFGSLLQSGLGLSLSPRFGGSGEIDAFGLRFSSIERVEIAVDGDVVLSLGYGRAPTGTAVNTLLAQADLWGLV